MDFSSFNFTVYIVYLITRDDGKQYVGTTNSKRLYHRMYHHRYSKRFVGHEFSYVILACWTTPSVFEYEEYFIQKYDTFYNGLNRSKDGKGNHLSPAFTTLGWKMPEETKRKIGEKSKVSRKARGHKWSAESRERASRIRRGRVLRPRKFSLDLINEIYRLYDMLPVLKGVGEIQQNGRLLSYNRAFSNTFASAYGMTPQFLYNLLKDRIRLKDAA